METIYVAGWDAFETEVEKLRNQLTQNLQGETPELLFRGLADSDWQLTTTLEREDCEGMSFDEYYRLVVHRVKPTVEVLTNTTWDVPEYDTKMEASFRDDAELFSLRKFPSQEMYRFMVYLRHHGFPSPLLDWTASMHIAAFFAFRTVTKANRRSIYVYCERPNRIKGGAVGEPSMRVIGPYVRAHARHFRQKSNYTICAEFDRDTGGWRFHKHDPVFSKRGRQDFLWKFDLPSELRVPILKKLDQYNLNAFSLFDSQETLLETMWFREHVPEKEMRQMYLMSNTRLPLTSTDLVAILKSYGYETHPKGMAQPLAVDIERAAEGKTAYFDVNADAVRRNGEVPERPIRLTFEAVEMTSGAPLWKLVSVSELPPGVNSKALDRQPETPKHNARWPD